MSDNTGSSSRDMSAEVDDRSSTQKVGDACIWLVIGFWTLAFLVTLPVEPAFAGPYGGDWRHAASSSVATAAPGNMPSAAERAQPTETSVDAEGRKWVSYDFGFGWRYKMTEHTKLLVDQHDFLLMELGEVASDDQPDPKARFKRFMTIDRDSVIDPDGFRTITWLEAREALRTLEVRYKQEVLGINLEAIERVPTAKPTPRPTPASLPAPASSVGAPAAPRAAAPRARAPAVVPDSPQARRPAAPQKSAPAPVLTKRTPAEKPARSITPKREPRPDREPVRQTASRETAPAERSTRSAPAKTTDRVSIRDSIRKRATTKLWRRSGKRPATAAVPEQAPAPAQYGRDIRGIVPFEAIDGPTKNGREAVLPEFAHVENLRNPKWQYEKPRPARPTAPRDATRPAENVRAAKPGDSAGEGPHEERRALSEQPKAVPTSAPVRAAPAASPPRARPADAGEREHVAPIFHTTPSALL